MDKFKINDKNIPIKFEDAPILFTISSSFRDLLDKNFNNNFKFIKEENTYTHLGKIKEIEYRFNNIGYRGSDVKGDEDFIAIGCSQTYGYGLPEEFTWPSQLEKILGSRVVNLGAIGASAGSSIMRAISYINQNKKPKAVFACLPIKRAEHFAVPGLTVGETNPVGVFISAPAENNIKKFSKAPHKFQEVVAVEDNIFNSFLMINLFDQYCKEAGIKFIWTGWEICFNDNRIAKLINNKTNGLFFYNKIEDIESSYKNKNCHSAYSNHPLFNYASDGGINSDLKTFYGHKGIHWNLHAAESFYSEYFRLTTY
jgi:hypothetical protein